MQEYGRLPTAFNKKFYHEVAQCVLLTDPAYNRILVKVSKKGNHLRFKDGWTMIGDIYNLPSGGWIRMYYDDPTNFTIQVLQRNLIDYVNYPRPPQLFRVQVHPNYTLLHDGDVDMCDAKPPSIDHNGLVDDVAVIVEYTNPDPGTVQPDILPVFVQPDIQPQQDVTVVPHQTNIQQQNADEQQDADVELNPQDNAIIMPNSEDQNPVVDHDIDYFYTLEKQLSSYQATCSSLPLKADFCSRAFPLKNKTCILVDEEGAMWPCELRWPGRSRYECVLTSGWKGFARAKELKVGSILRFRVSKYDPTRAIVVIIRN